MLPTVLIDQSAPQDSAFAQALEALSSTSRLALLRQLRTPKVLAEIQVKTAGPGDTARNISRQAVREHLDRLMEIGVVIAREAERDYGPTVEYAVNHQMLFALSEEFRGLARLRPAAEPEGATLHGKTPAAPGEQRGPALVMVKGLDEGKTFPLAPPLQGKGEWIIGRRRGVHVPLDYDPFVSSENTAVLWEEGTHFLLDLPESRNGTLLNFQPLAKGLRRALRPGDVVGVGRSLLVFRA